MFRYILNRTLLMIPTFLGIVLLTFCLLRLVPGDPIEVRLGERGLTPERHAEALHQMGLDKSQPAQFIDYIIGILHGNFGTSFSTGRPVLEEFLTLFPATLELTLCAVTLGILIGIPAGVWAASRRGSAIDHGLMITSLTGYSMPIFWWGLLLILTFSVNLHWTPVSGRIGAKFFIDSVTGFMSIDALLSGEKGAFKSALSHLILPSIVLGTLPLAVIARMTRSAMLEVLGQDYVRTAYSKGLSDLRVVGLHALRNALIPVVTVIGLQVGILLGGAIITETIFSWPGIGKWLIEAIARRDYPVLQGGVLIVSSMIICVNLLVDLLYGILNPRIRHGR